MRARRTFVPRGVRSGVEWAIERASGDGTSDAEALAAFGKSSVPPDYPAT
jgi:hypothetical protein